MNTQQYTVTTSTKHPVTIWYNGHGVVPNRQIIYRNPTLSISMPGREYGVITYNKRRVVVVRKVENGRWSQWEALTLVDPFAFTVPMHYAEIEL